MTRIIRLHWSRAYTSTKLCYLQDKGYVTIAKESNRKGINIMQNNKWPITSDFGVCTYKGKPAIYDKKARVYYTCKTMAEAKQRTIALNKGI